MVRKALIFIFIKSEQKNWKKIFFLLNFCFSLKNPTENFTIHYSYDKEDDFDEDEDDDLDF